MQVHTASNPSPVKLLVMRVAEKGKAATVRLPSQQVCAVLFYQRTRVSSSAVGGRMRHAIFVIVRIMPLVQRPQTLDRRSDEIAIQANEETHVAAWNKHNAKAVTAMFAPDADRFTPVGSPRAVARLKRAWSTCLTAPTRPPR